MKGKISTCLVIYCTNETSLNCMERLIAVENTCITYTIVFYTEKNDFQIFIIFPQSSYDILITYMETFLLTYVQPKCHNNPSSK